MPGAVVGAVSWPWSFCSRGETLNKRPNTQTQSRDWGKGSMEVAQSSLTKTYRNSRGTACVRALSQEGPLAGAWGPWWEGCSRKPGWTCGRVRGYRASPNPLVPEIQVARPTVPFSPFFCLYSHSCGNPSAQVCIVPNHSPWACDQATLGHRRPLPRDPDTCGCRMSKADGMGSVWSPGVGSRGGLGQMPPARGPRGQTLGRPAPKGCTQSFVWLKPSAVPLDLSFHFWQKWE